MRARLFALVLFATWIAATLSCASRSSTPHISVTAILDRAVAIAAHDAALSQRLAPHEGALERGTGEGESDRYVSEGWRAAAKGDHTGLGARLPASADGHVEVGPSRFDHLRIRMRLVDAQATPAIALRGHVVYESALPETDRVMTSDAHSLEELFFLRGPRAPKTFTWKVELPAGISRVTERGGGVVFERESGQPALVVPQPYAIDAGGARRDVTLTWDAPASELRLSLPDVAWSYPVLVDPDFETWSWTEVRDLKSRDFPAMAFDSKRGQAVLFSGRDITLNILQRDTWLWNGTLWRRVVPPVQPPQRDHHAMAYDAARDRVVLFGGSDGSPNGSFADTWTWDGDTWTKQMPLVAPPGRRHHAMAFDAARGRIVLFGGITSFADALDDTWTWDGATWTEAMPALRPSRRYAHAMTYDSVRNRVVLFGGSWPEGADTTTNDVLLWDGANWSISPTGAIAPSLRTGHQLAFDATRGRVVLFGGILVDGLGTPSGETWTWNGTWTRASTTGPATSTGHAMTFDAPRGKVLLTGGSAPLGSTETIENWFWDGAAWTQGPTYERPPQSEGHAMAFDTARGRVVLFGGSSGTLSADTWTFDGDHWAKLAPTRSPSARSYHRMAYDSANARIVLFGGDRGVVLSDTWLWDGTNWTRITGSPTPPARSDHAMAYDAARAQTVMFGGSDGTIPRSDTWTWNGTRWTRALPAISPTARSGSAMAYDAVRQRVVLFGGNVFGLTDDTWTWDGSAWTEVYPTGSPSPRYRHVMVFDPVAAQTVLFSGAASTGSSMGDTWLWNGTTWTQTFPGARPTERQGAAAAFDSTRSRTTLFGGNNGSYGDDTWALARLGGTCVSAVECPGEYCVDGVCCGAPSCATCETCAGTSPGRCTPILGAQDPSSCTLASGKSCDRLGACKVALGLPAASATECASGFLSDGVCCNEACHGSCRACRAELREAGTEDGICGAARAGLDPHADCEATPAAQCGKDGQCDGRGGCRPHVYGTACGTVTCLDNAATSRICDGSGACSADAETLGCGAYACGPNVGCKATCVESADCAPLFHCESSTCVADEGATCDGEHFIAGADGRRTDCSPYKCEAATCKTTCTSVADCVFPAECDITGRCAVFQPPPSATDGCSSAGGTHFPSMAVLFFAGLGICRRKQRAK